MDDLSFNATLAWRRDISASIEGYSKGYMEFIAKALTERRTVRSALRLLKDAGFKPIEEYEKNGERIKPGDSVYSVKAGKALLAFRIIDSLDKGFNMVAAHIDSPRLDLKPRPLKEKAGLALLKTHYYGGIKKYQWLNIPLALVGTVVLENGDKIDINIGTEPGDPVFVISDLLPHLDNRKGDFREVFKGKDLNALAASIPLGSGDKENSIKLAFLKSLNEKYGLKEEDLFSADLQFVPAIQPREIGIDRSMIGAYGQDDRICAYTAITALINANKLSRSAGVLLLDKEEIGSDGNTGAKSYFWMNALMRIARLMDMNDPWENVLLAMEKSSMLSGDVAAAINPMFEDAHDPENAPRLGHGIVLIKYTGRGGKGGTSEASAEFVARVRRVLNSGDIVWQTGTLGEVDRGGGGTVAKFFAEKGMDVIDAGPPLLGMHSPFEIASKADLYETYRAYKAFLEMPNEAL
ncbi:aminopeptidase [Kosmotoga pacifica]|uniref:M18 family aminopeptidase n=1 Tax=Kosmotoga pacifica TaxID=1330330 RepID=A0A0G2ZE99_9BACT|nr:aminopeptidase 1 [Kosmotoga pacifica]